MNFVEERSAGEMIPHSSGIGLAHSIILPVSDAAAAAVVDAAIVVVQSRSHPGFPRPLILHKEPYSEYS